MNRSVVIAGLLVALLANRVFAGHGFMNSFADVEWLPDPGCTPNEVCYVFDTLAERVMELIARFRGEALAFSLETAREKLAEASAMIKLHDLAAAERARERYLALTDAAKRALDRAPAAVQAAHRQRLMSAVLDHVYILSVDYVDMPLEIRRDVLRPVLDHAMSLFAEVRTSLSEAEQKALFFKEEEIRWSLEMAEQADVQEITNEFAGD